jgi:hypothetical protein
VVIRLRAVVYRDCLCVSVRLFLRCRRRAGYVRNVARAPRSAIGLRLTKECQRPMS